MPTQPRSRGDGMGREACATHSLSISRSVSPAAWSVSKKACHDGQPEEHELNKQLNELGSCVRKTNSGHSRRKRRLLIDKLFSSLVPKTPPIEWTVDGE